MPEQKTASIESTNEPSKLYKGLVVAEGLFILALVIDLAITSFVKDAPPIFSELGIPLLSGTVFVGIKGMTLWTEEAREQQTKQLSK